MNKQDRISSFHIATKTISQMVTIIIEVGGIGALFMIIFNYLSPPTDTLEYASRFLMGASIYEILVFFTLSQINDAKKDSLLAIITAYKYAELYCETGDKKIKDLLERAVNRQLVGSVFNHVEIRAEYSNLKEILKSEDITLIKSRIIHYEHCYEMESLKWRCSILLRLRK